jgi:diguanylate cyclase (GGDEF)-like protein
MHFDLFTLYYLAIGTLLLSAALTLWERQAQPLRRRELDTLAAGYVVLAVGCALATARAAFPIGVGAALSNVVMTSGYLIVLNGVALITGGRFHTASLILLVLLSLTWMVGGASWESRLWSYISAVPIALVCGATALEALKCDQLRSLRSRRVIVAISGGHAVFYAARAFVLPGLVARFGQDALTIASKVTMYEGVLYSISLPMSLVALVREEAHDRILSASRTDYLTGLANRRWFFEEGKRICDAPANRSLALLAFDLDHFKAINDRFGHDAGDEVLKLFAQAIVSEVGSEASVARLGGEEFAALLRDHDGLHALKIGQAIAAGFSHAVAKNPRYVGLKATVSIGIAEYGTDAADLGGLLSAADRALYAAKSHGRDRIEFATPASFAQAS